MGSLGRRRLLVAGLAGSLLAACGKSDPQARLDAAAEGLRSAIEARDTSAVMDRLDAHFRGSGDLDPEQARRLMTGAFLRYPNIRVVALSRRSEIDPSVATLARTEAQVLVTGAQGLIPERAEPYTLRLEWRWVEGDWKLADLRWD